MANQSTADRKAIAEKAFEDFDFEKQGVTFGETSGWEWTEPNPLRFERAVYVEQGEDKPSKKATFVVTLKDDGSLDEAYLNQ